MDETADLRDRRDGHREETADVFRVCKCPGCGGAVILPEDWAAKVPPRVLRQLAQAACGCWVSRLPEYKANRVWPVNW